MTIEYSRLALLLCVAMGIFLLTSTSRGVSAAPTFKVDPTRIYTPDQIDELREAIAYQNCERDPGCNPNLFFGNSDAKCSIGAGVDGMLIDMADVRSSGRKCNPFTGEVIWPDTGECVTLLTQGPCPIGSWIKLTLPELKPVCEPRPCEEGQALMGDDDLCHMLEAESMCPPGQSLLNNEFGMAECDCISGTVYHSLSQACHKPYTQGPCTHGQIIKVLDSEDRGKVECVPNPCQEENMVMLDAQCKVHDTFTTPNGTCYRIGAQGPCISSILSIDEVMMEPDCFLETEPHTIFNLPNIRGCQRGSIRDIRGRCRRDFSKQFGKLPSVVTSSPGSYNGRLCPKGQILLGGTCLRLSLNG